MNTKMSLVKHNKIMRQFTIAYFCAISLSFAGTSVDTLTVIQDYIKHADTYYWFGMAESGNVESFHKGHDYLNRAKVLLDGSKISNDTKIEVMD